MHWFDKPVLGGSKSGIRNFPGTALANEKGIPSLPAKINHEKKQLCMHFLGPSAYFWKHFNFSKNKK